MKKTPYPAKQDKALNKHSKITLLQSSSRNSIYYILSGAEKPSTSMHFSRTSLVSLRRAIQEAFCSSFSSERIFVSW